MRTLYDVPAPAKLNLFLHVTGRRADGYHLLQSVFMLIDWCDTLHFEPRAGSTITREDLNGTLPAEDLCLRAARALQAATGYQSGVHIGVHKRIPAQAGMGGGSSDAASTLLALNRLWKLNLARAELLAIGAALGADVPFFLGGHNAWVQGIGEQLHPLAGSEALAPARLIVVKPQDGVSTPAIFSNPNLQRDTGPATIAGFAAVHRTAPYSFGANDLQPVAEALCPGIAQALAWLASQGLAGRMTGSGSAVFAPVMHNFEPTQPFDGGVTKMCHNLGLHPLADWAQDVR